MRQAALAMSLVLVSLAVYGPVLQSDAGFVWDDDAELWGTRGQLVQADDGPLQAWWPIVMPEEGWHRVDLFRPVAGMGAWPLTPTILWIEWRVFGADRLFDTASDRVSAIEAVTRIAWRFHLPNILLHALAGFLIVLVLRRLRIRGASIVGLIFVVHPLCVPSVAWVSELKNTLSLPLLLLSTLLYLDWDERHRKIRYGLALAAFFFSLTAKTAGVGLPVVLLALIYFRHRRLSWADARNTLPFFAVAGAMAGLTLWFTAQSGGLGALGPQPGGALDRLALALAVPWFYLGKTFFPTDLTMIYPAIETPWSGPLPWLSLGVIGVVVGFGIGKREGIGSSVLAAAVAFGALLFPVLGLFRMTYAMHAPVADHLYYFALPVPLSLAIGGLASALASWPSVWRRVALITSLVAALLLAAVAHSRVSHWKNHETLWTQNVEVNPDAWMARYNLGSLLASKAQAMPDGSTRDRVLEEADRHLSRTIELEPEYVLAHYRHATVLRAQGKEGAALQALEGAVEAALVISGPNSVEVAVMRGELARALSQHGDLERSRSEYEASLATLPDQPATQMGFASVLERLELDAAAARVYEELLASHPRHPRALIGLSWLRSSSADSSVRDTAAALRYAGRAVRATERAGRTLRLRAREVRLAADAESAWQGRGTADRLRAVDLARETLALARRIGLARSIDAAHARLVQFSGNQSPSPSPLP